jgi:hypothetical protein
MILLEDYKSYADINSPNQDNKLTPLVAYVNDFIQRYCGTKFETTTVTGERVLISEGGFILPNAPVQSIENIDLIEDSREFDYWLRQEEGTVEVDFEDSVNARVDYTWGFSEVPEGLKVPCFELISYFYKREFNKSKSLGGETVTYLDPSIIPPHIRAGLDLYRYI